MNRRREAAEHRDQNRRRQQPAGRRTEQRGRGLFADPGGRADRRYWQRAEVDQVHEQVDDANQHGAADHPEREIALGTFDLAGGERRLVPAVEVAEDRHDREPHGRRQVARRQRRGPIRRDLGRREQPESNQAGDRQEFDGGQRALDPGSLLRAEVVHRRQHRDRRHARELHGVRLPRPCSHRNRRDHARRGEERHERSEILSERHAEVGVGSRLDRQQRGPTEEEAPKGAEGLFDVVVLPARLGKHRSQFGVASARRRWQSGRRPPREAAPAWDAGPRAARRPPRERWRSRGWFRR